VWGSLPRPRKWHAVHTTFTQVDVATVRPPRGRTAPPAVRAHRRRAAYRGPSPRGTSASDCRGIPRPKLIWRKPGTMEHEKRPTTTKRSNGANDSPAQPIRNRVHGDDERSDQLPTLMVKRVERSAHVSKQREAQLDVLCGSEPYYLHKHYKFTTTVTNTESRGGLTAPGKRKRQARVLHERQTALERRFGTDAHNMPCRRCLTFQC
jgi:hypothetical protein